MSTPEPRERVERIEDFGPVELAYAEAMHEGCEDGPPHSLAAHSPWSGGDLDGTDTWDEFTARLAHHGLTLTLDAERRQSVPVPALDALYAAVRPEFRDDAPGPAGRGDSDARARAATERIFDRLAAAPTRPPEPLDTTYHSRRRARRHAGSVTAWLTVAESGDPDMDETIRREHEATHGEAEQCGADCIRLGLADFDDDEVAPESVGE